MSLWLRILLTAGAVVLVGFFAGLIWMSVFQKEMPTYLSGLLGGLAAMPVWEMLKRIKIQSTQ